MVGNTWSQSQKSPDDIIASPRQLQFETGLIDAPSLGLNSVNDASPRQLQFETGLIDAPSHGLNTFNDDEVKEDEIQFIQNVVKREVACAEVIDEDMDASLIHQLFICPLCNGKSESENQIQEHVICYHKLSMEKLSQMGFKIQRLNRNQLISGPISDDNEMDPKLIYQLFICPMCEDKSHSISKIQEHVINYHKFSLDKLFQAGQMISCISI